MPFKKNLYLGYLCCAEQVCDCSQTFSLIPISSTFFYYYLIFVHSLEKDTMSHKKQ